MRPSLKEIASAAGVSIATVSYALRGIAKVSPKTRDRIVSIAQQRGYARDPQISHTLAYIRRHQKSVYRETLALLADYRLPYGAENDPWMVELRAAARTRAAELGYGLEVIHYESTPERQRRQSRQLHARGIRGIIITPDLHRLPTELHFDWTKFVAVEFDQSMAPAFLTRITRDVANDYVGMFEKLHSRGYQRIGLGVTMETEQRHFRAILAAYLTWNYTHRHGQPFIPELESFEPTTLARWMKKYQPDGVVANGLPNCNHLRALHPDVGICRIDSTGGEWSGLRPDYTGMGYAAIECIAASLERGEIGIPKSPRIISIPNYWHEGSSLKAPHPTERMEIKFNGSITPVA